jgi:hypothetical protein
MRRRGLRANPPAYLEFGWMATESGGEEQVGVSRVEQTQVKTVGLADWRGPFFSRTAAGWKAIYV